MAVIQVFPGATIKGCVFHFTQALWRKVQDLGLRPVYMERGSIYTYIIIRTMMALPFLPPQEIEPSFRLLAARASSDLLVQFVNYMDKQWMNNAVFSIESLSVYGLTVRTNNDTEGWHHALNRKAGGQSLSFYRLVPALRGEAEDISYQLRYLREGQTTRRVRVVSRIIEGKIQEAWSKYSAKELSTSELLAECAKVYGPQVELDDTPDTQITRL